MSRLIREADLIQGLQAVRDRETGTPRMMTEWFMTMVRDTPTAYDVEAVLAELGDMAMWREALIYPLDHRERTILAKVEEIVRGGRNDCSI